MKEPRTWFQRISDWLKSAAEGKAGPEDRRFRDFYRDFREGSLSVLDSFYNSLHICVHERLARTKRTVKTEAPPCVHPLGWEQKEQTEVYSGFWTAVARCLDALPRIVSAPFAFGKRKLFSRRKKKDNTLRFFTDAVRRMRSNLVYLVPLCVAVGVFFHMYSVANADIVLGAMVDGKKLGLVESADQLNEALDEAESKASNVLGRSFKFPYPVSYYFSHKEGFLTQKELYSALVGCLGEYICPGYGLYVDGKLVAALRSQKDIEDALAELVEEEQQRTPDFRVKLHSLTSVAQETFPTQKMTDREHLKELLLYGSSDFSTLSVLDDVHSPSHRVCERLGLFFAHSIGEDAYRRARKAAEDVDFSNTYYYYEDQEETPLSEVLPVRFARSEQISSVGELDFPVERIHDPQLYEGGEEIAVTGKKGLGIVITEYTYVDSVLLSREVVSTQVVSPPVTQVIRVGTKPLPEETVTDDLKIFILPRDAQLNSGFGWRDMDGDGVKDDFHNGLDIEAPMYSNIYASLSGTVIFAESYSTFGKLIRIRHDNGYETYYAHLDEILVKEGEQVRQGQLIGRSGNTGFTTGPHFHFELRKPNGSPVDPLKYIYKEKK